MSNTPVPQKPKRIVDYIIVSDSESVVLCRLVKNFLNSGYAPTGGVSYSRVNGVWQFLQAMVKFG